MLLKLISYSTLALLWCNTFEVDNYYLHRFYFNIYSKQTFNKYVAYNRCRNGQFIDNVIVRKNASKRSGYSASISLILVLHP